jgi:rhodanese-related sulfurtransferase
MSSINSIAPDKLARFIGMPRCPALVDVRVDEDFSADARFIPSSFRRSYENVSDWAAELRGRPVVVICQSGLKLSHGVAALLREAGAQAELLEGGFAAWARNGLPLVPANKLPRATRRAGRFGSPASVQK